MLTRQLWRTAALGIFISSSQIYLPCQFNTVVWAWLYNDGVTVSFQRSRTLILLFIAELEGNSKTA